MFHFLLWLHLVSGLTPYSCPPCVQIRVGPPTTLYGPVSSPLDSPFLSILTNKTLLAYSANGNTYIIDKGSLNNTLPPSKSPVALERGEKGNFDECGAWLNAARVGEKIVRGWYHAEDHCDYASNGQTHKSVAYAESTDGGMTFQKWKYPDNQILTGSKPPEKGQETGNGDHTFVEGNDGYFYIFYINWDAPYAMAVARAPASSGGLPGTWKKYYNGSFQENGLGGHSTTPPNLKANTVLMHESGELFGITAGFGATLSFGKDPITWSPTTVPLLFADGASWTRNPSSKELVAYPTLVPQVGYGRLQSNFWLYYTYLYPGEGFDKRWLLRREVVFVLNSPGVVPQSGTALMRYKLGNEHWTTTAVVPSGFNIVSRVGYVFPTHYPGAIPFLDCYITGWDDHMVSVSEAECKETGVTLLRQMGWIYETPPAGSPFAFLPLYRCFDAQLKKHDVSTNKECLGRGKMEFLLGWILE